MKGKLIATGATADVFHWGDSQVLKLFHPRMSRGAAAYEFKVAQAVTGSGVNAPRAEELIEYEGQSGIIYEYVVGEELLRRLFRELWRVPFLMREMAHLQAEMHSAQASRDLPVLHERLRYKIGDAGALSQRLKARLIRKLENLPDGNAVLHGDFHPRNILVDNDNYKIIDWVDAARGHPLADVARSFVILSEFSSVSDVGLLPTLSKRVFQVMARSIYLRHYFRITGYAWQDLQNWLAVVAGARLNEHTGQQERLLEMVHHWLSN